MKEFRLEWTEICHFSKVISAENEDDAEEQFLAGDVEYDNTDMYRNNVSADSLDISEE